MLPEPIAITLQVTDALEGLGVAYFIGGSLASAIHGISRATMDVDIVADLHEEHLTALVKMLEGDFYIDDEAVHTAILRHSSCNLIHRETMFKVDIFVRKARPYDHAQFDRRERQTLATEPERFAYVASAEDMILAKLEWYRMGGEVSERQWRDVQNIIKVQADRLDQAYLRGWAGQLGISDLLESALAEGL
jgi:hypothetical protein